MDTPEVKTVVHLHGSRVVDDSDGYPEAWYTPNYKITGPKFTRKVYEYTNHQEGLTMWYHDHAMGITRLNVYAGLAGFYFLRDSLEEGLNLPKGKYEIPLMIQDKSFNSDGSLFYPDTTPIPPQDPNITLPVPSIAPFFFGNTIVVNGTVWSYLNVEPRKYRFRILNASNRREYILRLSNGGEFVQIGTDGGLIPHPINIDSFKLMLSERIDLIIDFSQYNGQRIELMNDAQDSLDPGTEYIMRFNVVELLDGEDTSSIPDFT